MILLDVVPDVVWRILVDLVLAFVLVAGLVYAWMGIGLFRDVAAILATRTTTVANFPDGADRVEVQGTVRTATETVPDPATGREAVAYEYEIKQEDRVKDDVVDWTRWGYDYVTDGVVAMPFYVDDGTGRVLVEPGDVDDDNKALDGVANVYAPDADAHHETEGTPPGPVQELFERTDADPAPDRGRLYRSAAIEPGDPVYVLGVPDRRGGEPVIHGGDGRFVVAGASQLRTVVYNTGWGLLHFFGGLAVALFCAVVLWSEVASVVGVVPGPPL